MFFLSLGPCSLLVNYGIAIVASLCEVRNREPEVSRVALGRRETTELHVCFHRQIIARRASNETFPLAACSCHSLVFLCCFEQRISRSFPSSPPAPVLPLPLPTLSLLLRVVPLPSPSSPIRTNNVHCLVCGSRLESQPKLRSRTSRTPSKAPTRTRWPLLLQKPPKTVAPFPTFRKSQKTNPSQCWHDFSANRFSQVSLWFLSLSLIFLNHSIGHLLESIGKYDRAEFSGNTFDLYSSPVSIIPTHLIEEWGVGMLQWIEMRRLRKTIRSVRWLLSVNTCDSNALCIVPDSLFLFSMVCDAIFR